MVYILVSIIGFLLTIISSVNGNNSTTVNGNNSTALASCQALSLISVSYVFEGFNNVVNTQNGTKRQNQPYDNDTHYVGNPHVYDMLPYFASSINNKSSNIPHIASAPVYDWDQIKYTKYASYYNKNSNSARSLKKESLKSKSEIRDENQIYNVSGNYNLLITSTITQNLELCFTSDLNGYDTIQTYGKGFVSMSEPTQVRLKVNWIRSYLSISTYQNCATNIKIGTNCNCDCPLGYDTCDSSTDQCADDGFPSSICDNTYEGGVYPSDCGDQAQRAELCCEYHLSNCSNSIMYFIGNNVNRVANITLTTNNILEPGINTSNTFLVDLDNPNYQVNDDILLVFQGSFSGNTYIGGEYIMRDPYTPFNDANGYYWVSGYNSANSYDVTEGCWLKVNSQGNTQTSSGNFAKTYSVSVDSCGDNDFTFTAQSFNPTIVSSGNELFANHVSPFGTFNLVYTQINETVPVLGHVTVSNLTGAYIEEINSPSITVSITINAKNAIFDVKITGVYNLSCTATALYSQGGSLNCTVVFEDIGFSKLTIYDPDMRQIYSETLESTEVNQTVHAIVSLLAIASAINETYSACMPSSLTIGNNNQICVNFGVSQNIIVISDPHGPTIVQNGGSHGEDSGDDWGGIGQALANIGSWFTSGFWDYANWKDKLVAIITIIIIILILIGVGVAIFYCIRLKLFSKIFKGSNKYKTQYKHLYDDDVEMHDNMMHHDIDH